MIVSPFSVTPDSFPGGTHYIVGNVRLAPLSDEHKARIVEYLDSVQEDQLSRFVRSRPAFIIPYSEVSFLKAIGSAAERNILSLQLHRFALEYFSACSVPMAAFSFDGKVFTGHDVDQDGINLREAQLIELQTGVWEKQAAYLQFLYPNLSKAPAADIVINRICRAVRGGSGPDGIIDLCIALESLVDAKLEIKFQFCLFNSLINGDDCAVREHKFTMLQSLYDVRSSTVHGSKLGNAEKRKLKSVTDNWNDLVGIARTNLTYYIEFCRTNNVQNWPNHLRSLAFGAERLKIEA